MRKSFGFTLIELLVAMIIFAGIMTLIVTYLGASNESTRRTQVRSEVQDRVRTVMQLVSQDLQLAGSSRLLNANSTTVAQSVANWLPCGSSQRCVSLVGTDTGATNKDTVRVRYVTSLAADPANACRIVEYTYDGNTVRRGDDAGCTSYTTSPAPSPIADNILALNITYLCSDSSSNANPANCPAGSYPRTAQITVMGTSASTIPGYVDPGSYSVACPAGRICYELRQEVLMPSMKDN